jgi:hypothetical protein
LPPQFFMHRMPGTDSFTATGATTAPAPTPATGLPATLASKPAVDTAATSDDAEHDGSHDTVTTFVAMSTLASAARHRVTIIDDSHSGKQQQADYTPATPGTDRSAACTLPPQFFMHRMPGTDSFTVAHVTLDGTRGVTETPGDSATIGDEEAASAALSPPPPTQGNTDGQCAASACSSDDMETRCWHCTSTTLPSDRRHAPGGSHRRDGV